MASPIYARTIDGIKDEVFSRFYRVSIAETGDILAEFGAAHIVDAPDARRFPPGSVLLDRYGGMRPSRAIPTPCVITARPANAALIAAVRAMRPADVSHLQNDDNGCGAAVVATLRGISYAESVKKLFKGRSVRMLGTQRLAAATGTTCRRSGAETLSDAIKADAVAALIRRDGAKWGHYVAIAPGGVIVDPELILKYPLAEYPRRGWRVVAWFAAGESLTQRPRRPQS